MKSRFKLRQLKTSSSNPSSIRWTLSSIFSFKKIELFEKEGNNRQKIVVFVSTVQYGKLRIIYSPEVFDSEKKKSDTTMFTTLQRTRSHWIDLVPCLQSLFACWIENTLYCHVEALQMHRYLSRDNSADFPCPRKSTDPYHLRMAWCTDLRSSWYRSVEL
jgi:hypothetical protein